MAITHFLIPSEFFIEKIPHKFAWKKTDSKIQIKQQFYFSWQQYRLGIVLSNLRIMNLFRDVT